MNVQKLRLAQGLFITLCCPLAHAQLSTATDRNAFISDFPTHIRNGFDLLSAGTNAPFITEGVQVSGTLQPTAPQVTNSLLGNPHSFWFQGFGSPANFVLANNQGFEFHWTSPIHAAGFDLQCFACDTAGNPSSFLFDAFNALGNSIGTIEQIVLLDFTVRFVSVRSTVAFQTLRVRRGGPGNYMMDELRFAADRVFASGFE